MSRSDLVDLELLLLHETEKAWLVSDDDTGEGVWIAKSMCERGEQLNASTYVFTMTESVATSKGLT